MKTERVMFHVDEVDLIDDGQRFPELKKLDTPSVMGNPMTILRPGDVGVIECGSDWSQAQVKAFLEDMKRAGEFTSVQFIVLPAGASVVRKMRADNT